MSGTKVSYCPCQTNTLRNVTGLGELHPDSSQLCCQHAAAVLKVRSGFVARGAGMVRLIMRNRLRMTAHVQRTKPESRALRLYMPHLNTQYLGNASIYYS